MLPARTTYAPARHRHWQDFGSAADSSSLGKQLGLEFFPRHALVRVAAMIIESLLDQMFVPFGDRHLIRRETIPQTLDQVQPRLGRQLKDLFLAQCPGHVRHYKSRRSWEAVSDD